MVKTMFVCSNCGYESGKWYGKCPSCQQWNTFQEFAAPDKKKGASRASLSRLTRPPTPISQIKSVAEQRISTGIEEFDRVLGGVEVNPPAGGGIVPGSVILLSGDPGVGKSTILLQLALQMSSKNTVLYASGEESESQVKLRAERIAGKKALSDNLFLQSTNDIEQVVSAIESQKPSLVVVDSIQTMATSDFPGFAGSIPQIRHATTRLVSLAKEYGIPIFIVGHVTKEGIVAGPMTLSHMVDTVLYLEGEQVTGTRILRSFKNRFGDTSEVGIFLMEEQGLKQISDASGFFTNEKDRKVAGSCLTVAMEGSRPILIEVQALVVPSSMAFPRRVAAGISDKRLQLLLAVVQKHVRIPVERMDVFVNVVGGLTIKEPAIDLAVCMAIISSYKATPYPSTVAIGEVGLLGEIKTVFGLEKRMKEAKKFGFNKVLSVKTTPYLSGIEKGV